MRPDLGLVGSYIALSILGLLMVYTASISRLEEAGISPTRDLERQGAFVVAGFIAFALMSAVDLRYLQRWVPAIYVANLFALIVVLTPLGDKVRGVQRWIDIGPLHALPNAGRGANALSLGGECCDVVESGLAQLGA